jgi:hypothetical protein
LIRKALARQLRINVFHRPHARHWNALLAPLERPPASKAFPNLQLAESTLRTEQNVIAADMKPPRSINARAI